MMQILLTACPSLHLDLYFELCTIEVDLSHLWGTSNIQILPKPSTGRMYYKVRFDVVMLFGGTEIQAQLCWKENVRLTNFENCFYCVGTDHANCFLLYILLACREEVMIFFFSLIEILIPSVGSI